MISYMTLSFLVFTICCCHLTVAQIPRVCSDETSLRNKHCCPVPDTGIAGYAGPCGFNLGRGSCVETSSRCNIRYTRENDETEPRLNWPSYFFSRVCKCNGNYAGYDCSECKFGYGGDDCNTKKQLRTRKDVNDADMPWDDYITKLNQLKDAQESRYVVVLFNESIARGGVTDDPDYEVQQISIYNMFAWMHHYVAKNNNDSYYANSSANDYAHESSGFLTWHRLFLLWLEREAQLYLNDPDFTLRYWNWTEPNNRTSLFVNNKLGGNDGSGEVTGNFSNWTTVCWFPKGSPLTCNISDSAGIYSLRRCPILADCTSPDYWPTADSVKNALNYSDYRDRNDAYPFNKYALKGFSNRLEGFILSTDSSDGSILGYIDGNGSKCFDPNTDCKDSNRQLRPRIPIERELHNLVHIILGLGSLRNAKSEVVGSGEKNMQLRAGVMADVAASANDPVFLNHHTMIDRLFEQWLQNQPSPQYVGPMNDRKFAGHSENDCIVPFIPYYTHRDMFKKASEFGYEYDGLIERGSNGLSLGSKIAIGVSSGLVGILTLVVSVVAIMIFVIYKRITQ